MNVLFFGDIVCRAGREAVKKVLPAYKEKYGVDFTIANVENMAHGKGVSESTLKEMSEAGIDFFTSGNHVWDNKDGWQALEKNKYPIIRPANYPVGTPGCGYKIVMCKFKRLLIVNLLGRVFIKENCDDPFRCLDEILEKEEGNFDYCLVDWHADATSEKRALGFYFDGRVSAVIGTHTHVPTADEQVLPGGTAYISDVGMAGTQDSILGVKKEICLKNLLTQLPHKMECAEGPCEVNAVIISLDDGGIKAKNIARIRETVV